MQTEYRNVTIEEVRLGIQEVQLQKEEVAAVSPSVEQENIAMVTKTVTLVFSRLP